MLDRIFPRQVDNNYRGHWLATWILGTVVAGRFAVGINGSANTRFVAMAADGIPLDRYAADAAETVIALFALTALLNLVIGFLGLAVLIRWRTMIPFTYLLLLFQSAAGRIVLYLHPIARSGAQTMQIGTIFLLALLALTALGFALSLVRPRGTLGADRATA
jgi:hypothetical protein